MFTRKTVPNTQSSPVGKSRLAWRTIRRAAIETLESRTLLTVTISPVAALPAINEGTALNNVEVATFTDSAGALAPLQYAALINWGDGSAYSGGKVVNISGNDFEVFGSHTYSEQSVPEFPAYNISVSIARGDLLTNPGFELPAGFGSYASIPGWTLASGTGGGTIEIAGNNIGTPYEGNQFTELNSSAPATIFQTVPTTPGQTYTFSFAFSARPGTTAADNHVQLSVGGNPIATITADGTSLSATSWTDYTFTYSAPSASTTIQFASLSPAGDSVGGELDAVQLAPLTSGPVTTTTQVVNEAPITNLSATTGLSNFATVGSGPDGLAFDKSGNLYVANFFDNTVDKITPGGVVSTFINTGLNGPKGLAFDSSGNLFVANFNIGEIAEYNSSGALITAGFNATGFAGAPDQLVIDSGNSLYLYTSAGDIYKITPAGAVSTYVSGLSGNAGGLAFDAGGDLFVTDFNNNQVDKVPPGGGPFSVFASGFNQPRDLVIDGSGNLYVSNGNNNSISKVTSGGSVSTYVSGGPLNYPYAVALGAGGNLYVTNGLGTTVTLVTPPQSFTINEGAATPAITGLATFTDPAGAEAVADYTTTINWGDATTAGTVVNTGGNNFRVDAPAHKYSEQGVYTVLVTVQHETAAQQSVVAATVTVNEVQITNLAASGAGPVTTFATVGNEPDGLTFGKSGNLYVADYLDNSIDKVTPSGVVSTLIPGSGLAGFGGLALDSSGNFFVANYNSNSIAKYNSAGTLVTGAFNTTSISGPDQMVIDSGNNLYVYDGDGNIDKITPAGAVSTYVSGLHSTIGGLAFDASGDLFVTDFVDGQVDKVPPGGGPFSVFASGVPSGLDIVIDASGNLYVSDNGDYAIDKVTPGGSVSTYVNGGLLNGPYALALDAGGNLYVTNFNGNTVVKVAPGPLSVTADSGGNISAITGLATFTDPAGAEAAADYAATINWGDGATSPGSVVNTGGNNFRIDAPAHTYTGPGTYSVTVAVTHETAPTQTVPAANVTVPAAQPSQVTADQDNNGNVQISFPAPAVNGLAVTYQVMRSVNGGAYANAGSPIASTGAASYTFQDPGPLVDGSSYTYEVSASGSATPPTASNTIEYLFNPLVSHPTFTSTETDLRFNNGSGAPAAINDVNQVQLTNNTGGEANSVYAANPVQINGNWQTSFDFQISNPGADGMTFLIQAQGSSAVGQSGGALGYTGTNNVAAGGIARSVGFAFNQYNGVTQTAFGADVTGAGATLAPYIGMDGTLGNAFHPAGNTTDLFQVSLSYDSATGNFYEVVRDTANGLGFTNAYTPAYYTAFNSTLTKAALNALFSGADGPLYAGFTGATGGVASTQTIDDWTFNTTQAAPAAVQPVSISANERTGGLVLIAFPAPPTNGVSGVKYQVLRSVNGGAYANLGATIPNTGAADYAVPDFGPFIQRATYTYEVIISGTTPASPATSNPVQYLYNPVVSHLLFTAGESDLTFNQAGAGDAPTINAANQLQLSDNTNSDANSVYAANSVQINGNWQTSFSYQITNPGADGFTFVIQSNGSNVTGNSGGGLGYAGGNLSSSLAFAFNQFSGVTQTAMGANGTLAPYITMNGALGNAFHPAVASTDLFQVSLSYDHLTGNFYEVVRDTVTGLGYSATFTPALYGAYNITQAQVAALFAGPVFVGFTAGTGAVNSIQTIDTWAFNTIPAPALVGKPVINGDNPNGLFNAAGQGATAGVQRSMVEDMVYSFNEPVTIPNANSAFTVVGAGAHPGTVPSSLSASAIPGSNGTQWAITLTGGAAGALGSIANGEYSISINASGVFAAADGVTPLAAGRTDQFYRLFGDVNGAEVVNAADNLQLKKAITNYNPAFDSNADGAVTALDNLAFKKDLIVAYFGDGFVPTI